MYGTTHCAYKILKDKSFLNIVDTRDYKEHQVIRMHEQGPELNTTGLCFSSDGTRIYVGKLPIKKELAQDINCRIV